MQKISIFLLFLFGTYTNVVAQLQGYYVSQKDQKKYIDTLSSLFKHHYSDSIVANETAATIATKFMNGAYKEYAFNEVEFINALSHDFRRLSKNPQVSFHYTLSEIGSSYFYIHKRGKANFLLKKKYQRIIFGDNVQEWTRSEDFINNKKLRKLIRKANTSWAAIAKHNQSLVDKHGQPIKVNKKWRKKTYSNQLQWNSLYLLPQRHLKQELYDKLNDQPLYYNQKGSEKYLFGKHITLKQALQNYGFQEMKMLSGNVAYLKISSFPNPNYIDKEIIAYVTGFIANADALIIDLQNTKEGDMQFLPLFCSYFVPDNQQTVIAELVARHTSPQLLQTLGKLPKKHFKLTSQKLYVLVNEQTMATAEVFANFLKTHRQATLIGQPTAGAMYLSRRHTIQGAKLYFHIPSIKIILPENKKGNSVNIQPDSLVESQESFSTAYQMSLAYLADTTRNDLQKTVLKLLLNYEKAKNNKIIIKSTIENNTVEIDTTTALVSRNKEIYLKDSTMYVGSYQFQKNITFKNGYFYFQNYDQTPVQLLPLSNTLFMTADATQFALAPLHYTAPYAGAVNKVCYLQFIVVEEEVKGILLTYLDKIKYKVDKIK